MCAMCQRCVELDAKIDEWRRMASGVNDKTAKGLIHYEIEMAEREKVALHPEQS
jgi:hypothetical protein